MRLCTGSVTVRLGICLAVGGSLLFPAARVAVGQSPIIIDHTCTDLSKIPSYWIEQAKANLRVAYGHTSHGGQLITGIATLNSQLGCSCSSCSDGGCTSCVYGYCDDYNYYTYGGNNPVAPAGVLSLWDAKFTGASDLGNPDRTQWEASTRTMLNDSRYNRNVVMWSWCGQADTTSDNIQIYLNLMSGLVEDYPNVQFVYMTGHLVGTGETGNLHLRNNQIRSHVIATNGVLFDFADIESYDPSGNYYLDLLADDGCNYKVNGVTHNWASEWCAANPGSELCASCSCAHSQPLNCNLKGRAFWWLMARLAGWSGSVRADLDGDSDVDGFDFLTFSNCYNGSGRPPLEACVNTGADIDADEDVDGFDFLTFANCYNGSGNPPLCQQ